MSQLLSIGHRDPKAARLRLFLIGAIGGLALMVATTWLGLSFMGVVNDDVNARAHLLTSGESLGVNSDVKFRGIRVGRVLSVRSGSEPSAEIVIMKQYADRIPTDVKARLLPGTLFGNEYVDLVGGRPGSQMREGQEIAADTSAATLQLMDVFSATQRLLSAVQPAKLDRALAQLAEALDGKGATMSKFIKDSRQMLDYWARTEPTVMNDLQLLARATTMAADVEPQFVQALRDSLPVVRTLTSREDQIATLLRLGTRLAATADNWLVVNGDRLAAVLANSARTMRVFAGGASSFTKILNLLPAVLENGAAAVRGGSIRMDAAFGTDMPAPYTAAQCPRYEHLRGRNCP